MGEKDEISALKTEIARLKEENERLKKALKASNLLIAEGADEAQKIVESLRTRLEEARSALDGIATMPKYDQDDEHRLRFLAKACLEKINQK